ncbi:hypothetical protein HYDPIDRAFT_32130 [Hydnomerulius pinastri MD-312]|uniref:Uncharacterized protein n=1 Tax=Hydnomerulius pinastri MD-312 TaxID=994086 RepID=A0A0C9V4P2_9AGAM|nr:hypothetical protein HYDPIDRAFT_32130 [Hydnomerulius pinastri MD-312]
MAQSPPPTTTILPIPVLEPESVEEREVDELLDSEEVSENTQSLSQDPELLEKFNTLWRKTWPADVIDAWVNKQTEPCVECQKRSLKCESKPRALRCTACARSRRGPCSRWRAFQIHQVAVTLNLSPTATEALARQLEFKSTKFQFRKPKRSVFKHTPAIPSSMRFLQRPSHAPRSGSPQVVSAPVGETVDESEMASSSGTSAQSASHPPIHLRIKLPALNRRTGDDAPPSADQQVGGADDEGDAGRVSRSTSPNISPPHSPPHTPEDPTSPNLVWPDVEVPRADSADVPEPSYEPPPPVEPPATQPEQTVAPAPTKVPTVKDKPPRRPAKRSVAQADIAARDEEIARLKAQLEVQEREIVTLRQEVEAVDDLPSVPGQQPGQAPPSFSRSGAVSENENSTRRYLALQYISRTLKGARDASASQEQRDGFLARAERHLARLAHLEMEGIWRSDVDADEVFAGLARDSWDNGGNLRKRRRVEG